MKAKKMLIPLLLFVSSIFVLSACADKTENYKPSGLEVKEIAFNYGQDEMASANAFNNAPVKVIKDYDNYSSYNFNLDYTKTYFEQNNLLVFVVQTCSSEETEFGELLENEGKLYPVFYREEAKDPLTDDVIIMPYCVELPKEAEYQAGEIIYRNK